MTRHSWEEKARDLHRTLRQCRRCELIKISRHEFEGPREVHWLEFWRGTERIECDGTPACEPQTAEAIGE